MSSDIIIEIEKLLEQHKEKLRRIGIKKINQCLEIAFLFWKDHYLTEFLEKS